MDYAANSGGWTSSPVWVPLGVLVALGVGAALIFLTWRLAINRQRLFYSTSQTSIITSPQLAPKSLTLVSAYVTAIAGGTDARPPPGATRP